MTENKQLAATEPLIAENEELRRERDGARDQVEGAEAAIARFVGGDCALDEELVETLLASLKTRAESARSTSEALAGALERLIANAEHIFDEQPVRDWGETLAEAHAALDSARTPTEENPNG